MCWEVPRRRVRFIRQLNRVVHFGSWLIAHNVQGNQLLIPIRSTFKFRGRSLFFLCVLPRGVLSRGPDVVRC